MPARARAGGDRLDAHRGLYGALAEIAPSPVVELNRAVALAMLFGPEAGLEVVDALTEEPSLKAYHLLPERARRPARQAGPLRGGPRRVRARRLPHPQRARAQAAARPRRRLRLSAHPVICSTPEPLAGSPEPQIRCAP